MSGFLGAGTLFTNLYFPDGARSGWQAMGNTTAFTISPQGKLIQRKSTGNRDYGQVLDTVALPEPTKLAISTDELSINNLALALQGLVVAIPTAAGVGSESFTVAKGDMVSLSHQNISNVTSTGHAIDVDFRVFPATGLIEVLPAGNITDGASVTFDYSYGGASGYKVQGSRSASITAELRLEGTNLADGKSIAVLVDKAILQSKKEVAFISSEKFVELQLEGSMVTLPGKTHPYEVVVVG